MIPFVFGLESLLTIVVLVESSGDNVDSEACSNLRNAVRSLLAIIKQADQDAGAAPTTIELLAQAVQELMIHKIPLVVQLISTWQSQYKGIPENNLVVANTYVAPLNLRILLPSEMGSPLELHRKWGSWLVVQHDAYDGSVSARTYKVLRPGVVDMQRNVLMTRMIVRAIGFPSS